MKEVERDYEELLRLFNKHKVRFCVVGAFAVAFYAVPRYTKDIDLLIEPSPGNGARIMRALGEFGFGSLSLSADDFVLKRRIVQLGYEPVRVDVITSIEGCSFEQVWKNKKPGRYGKEKIYFIGLNELIKNKRSSKRKQDEADLELLVLARKRKNKK